MSRKRGARVFCTCFRNREERENPGAPLTSDCRGNLRRIHQEFQAKHGGLHLRHGMEPEMMDETSRLLEPFRFSRYAERRLDPVSHSPFPWN